MIDMTKTRETLGLNKINMARLLGIHKQLWLKWERKEQGASACPERFLEVLILLKNDFPDVYRAIENKYLKIK